MRYLLLFVFIGCFYNAYSQQDIDFQLTNTFLTGKKVIKVKRDYNDEYLWVLAANNEVYRINSITNAIDDYTSQFNQYGNLQFVDIAGRSMDTVFIATNSANVIEYKKGILKDIGVADGVAGTVNAVGIDNAGRYNEFINNNYTLLITTSNGICRYNYQTETMAPVPANAPSRIFEVTYRNEMLSDGEFCRCYPGDTVNHTGVFDLIAVTIFGGEIWTGGNSFGNNIKTAFYTSGNQNIGQYDTQFSINANQFWATENGLFQNFWNYSYISTSGYPYHHYLNGVDIRKITSIMGLLSFDVPYIRENLLIGTAQGLYFSNSEFQIIYDVPQYSLLHYAGLGNTAINDICVNATSYTKPLCENGVWVAADNGLYYLIPDYSSYVDQTKKISALQFDGEGADVSELTVCSGATVKADITMNSQNFQNFVKWFKDGKQITNQSGISLNITQSGDYNAVLYDPCSNIHFETNHLKVTQTASPIFSFNYPGQMNYCDGSTATLKTDDNPNYSYRWYTNGVLNGNTTPTLTTIQGGKYKVEVSGCSGTWVASKEVEIDFIKPPQPVVKTDKPAYCSGEQAVLSAVVSTIDASNIINWQPYQYRWYTNGALNGQTTPAITVNQPGKYKVEITSCSDNWVASDEIEVDFITIPTPIIITDKPAYCTGDNATLAINFVNDGTYDINWYRDGNAVPEDKNKTSIQTNAPGSYTVTIGSNLTSCSQGSVPFILSFDAPPSISIEQIVNTTLCDGETIDLKATYSAGTIKWSTGETSDEISAKQSGNYSATVTTPAGCVNTQTSTVQFLANPVLSVPDATLCQFTNQTITLTAPAGYVKYEWNGNAGNSTFSTNALGNVILTVTDANGCKATQTIHISSHCDDIHIPNAFTPNGDGINDTWIISGLEGDISTVVRVYNRYGTLIFQSKGYSIPWDGTYNGKKVPAGTFYYIINAKANNQILSGPVTVIY